MELRACRTTHYSAERSGHGRFLYDRNTGETDQAANCAAVFFVTQEFKDENFLATEVDYAIKEKRAKADRFAIITLVFGNGAGKGTVPDLLRG
jgi:hypothetical protein